MAIIIKNPSQIEKMRVAGALLARTLELIEKAVKPGVTTKELDRLATDFILANGAKPSFLGYEGAFGAGPYPGGACLSINEEVIHGIPGLRALKSGDIISIDIGVYLGGYHADAARTVPVGDISPENQRLIDVTKQSFFEGIKYAVKGGHLFDISAAIQDYVEKNGFSIVRDYVGHGIGKHLHEAPEVPHYKPPQRGVKLVPGMALAIEPMVNVGGWQVKVLDDLWTVVTADGKNSAHYENTIIITDGEPEIITMPAKVG